MPYAIDQQRLNRAAAELLDVAAAGHGDRIMGEFYARKREAGIVSSYRDPLREGELDWQAERLAILTEAPLHQCKAAVREASGDLAARAIGLGLLSETAAIVRRAEARQRRERRRRA